MHDTRLCQLDVKMTVDLSDVCRCALCASGEDNPMNKSLEIKND